MSYLMLTCKDFGFMSKMTEWKVQLSQPSFYKYNLYLYK